MKTVLACKNKELAQIPRFKISEEFAENPSLAAPALRAFYNEACDVYKIGEVSRPEFLKIALQIASKRRNGG